MPSIERCQFLALHDAIVQLLVPFETHLDQDQPVLPESSRRQVDVVAGHILVDQRAVGDDMHAVTARRVRQDLGKVLAHQGLAAGEVSRRPRGKSSM